MGTLRTNYALSQLYVWNNGNDDEMWSARRSGASGKKSSAPVVSSEAPTAPSTPGLRDYPRAEWVCRDGAVGPPRDALARAPQPNPTTARTCL